MAHRFTFHPALVIVALVGLVTGLVVAVPPAGVVHANGAIIGVSMAENVVWGDGWPGGSPLELYIDDPDTPGAPDFSATQVSCDSCGPNGLDVQFFLGGMFDIQPGHIVTMTDGTTTKVHQVRFLEIEQIDLATNTASGVGDAAMPITIAVLGGGFGSVEGPSGLSVDSSGSWSYTFEHDLGVDPMSGWVVARSEADEDGDATYHARSFQPQLIPVITVTPSVDVHHGDEVNVEGSGFYPNETVELMMGVGFVGGFAPETAVPVQADGAGSFEVRYSVARLINAKVGPFVNEYSWFDCAALDPMDENACFIATFNGSHGSYAQEVLQFEQTWVSLGLDARGSVSKAGGVATVSGVVTCPALPSPGPGGVEAAGMSGELYQRVGRKAVAAGRFATTSIRCTGEPVRWSAAVTPTGGVPFAGGDAELFATARIVTMGTYVPTTAEHAIIRLVVDQAPKRVK